MKPLILLVFKPIFRTCFQCSIKFVLQLLLAFWETIILLIPLIAGSIAYQSAIHESENDAVESTQMLLEQSRLNVESRLMEVENIVSQIGLNSKVSRLMYEESTYFSYHELNQDLKNITFSNKFIDNIFVYFRNNDVIVRDNYVIDKPELYFNTDLKYGNLSYSEWKDMLFSKFYFKEYFPATIGTSANKKESIVTLIQSLPITYVEPIRGTVVVTIREEEIKKLISSTKLKGGWAYIAIGNCETL